MPVTRSLIASAPGSAVDASHLHSWRGALTIAVAIWIVWFQTLWGGFVSDDFMLLYAVINQELFWHGLKPGTFFLWRPVTHSLYFDLLYGFFGLNPLAFKILNLLLHTVNALLVQAIVSKLCRERAVGTVAGLFYALNMAHIHNHMLAGGVVDILSTLSYFSAFGSYLLSRTSGRRHWWMAASILSFIVGILSKENVISLPMLLLWYEVSFHWHSDGRLTPWLRDRVRLIPFLLIAVALILLRLLFFSASPRVYRFSVDWSLPVVAGQYLWWGISLNLGYRFDLSRAWGLIGLTIFAFWAIWAIRSRDRILIFAAGWSILTLFPYPLMPDHIAPHYIMVPLLGIGLAAGYAVVRASTLLRRLLGDSLIARSAWIALLCWVALSSFLVAIRVEDHPRTRQDRFAKCTLRYLNDRYPHLSPGARVYFRDLTQEQKWAIYGGSMLNVYYHDLGIRSVFVPDPDPSLFLPRWESREERIPTPAPVVLAGWQIEDACIEWSREGTKHDIVGRVGAPAGETPAIAQEPHPKVRLNLNLGGYIELLGYDVERNTDGKLFMTFYWKALAPTPVPYSVFIHFSRGPNQPVVFHHHHWPIYNSFLTTRWRSGEVYRETYTLRLPLGVSQGNYTIAFGLFAPTLPRDHPQHRLHIREASSEVSLEEGDTKALIGYLQVM